MRGRVRRSPLAMTWQRSLRARGARQLLVREADVAAQAFYRKWRSQRFADLVGQEAVAQTLRNAVRSGRIAHAYIFCGPRGVGKTSAARILAKALNCPNAMDGEPCARCEMCQAIQEGRALDVLEIDAASNRGIDEIRGIREKVGLAPAAARYKFYILDEAHMLTVDAFNALLKTLEEPPAHTVFVLVTTEVQRLPETVRSRCQRLDFRRIRISDAIARLEFVCQQEGIRPEPGVLDLLARTAAGSLRDAEGMLDQVVAYAGTAPTLAAARAVIGAVGPEVGRELIGLIVADQPDQAIRRVNSLVEQGADPAQIAHDIIGCLRALLLLRTSETLADVLDVLPEEVTELNALARRLDVPCILEMIRAFLPSPGTRQMVRPQLPLELGLVTAAEILRQRARIPTAAASPRAVEVPSPRPSRSSLETTEGRAEEEQIEGSAISPAAPQVKTLTASRGAEPSDNTASYEAGLSGGQLDDVARRWNEILDVCGMTNRSVQALLRAARPVGVEEGCVVLGFPYEFHRERIEDPKNRVVVEEAIARVLGRPVRVRCTLVSREVLAARDPLQRALEDPIVRAAVSMGARIRSVTEDDA